MTHAHARSAVRTFIIAALGLGLLTAGCGSDDNDTASSAGDDAETAYCEVVRDWVVHQLAGDGDDASPDPVAFEKYWGEYVTFLEDAEQLAPDEIRDEWASYSEVPRVQLTAIFEKYDYDLERMEAEGTDEERAKSEPNEEQDAAQDAVHAYESRTCGTEEPPAADVSFEGAVANEGYCEAWSALNDAFAEQVLAEGFAREGFEAFMTSAELPQLLDAIDENAPEEIKEDVLAENEWNRDQWTAVIEKYDFDARKLLLDGPTADLAVFNRTAPEIVEHASRNTAYQEQLCAPDEEA